MCSPSPRSPSPKPISSVPGSCCQKKSTDVDLYRNLSVRLEKSPAGIVVVNRWGGSRFFLDSLVLPADGREVRVPITNRVFPGNVFMGLMMPVGEQRSVKAVLEKQRLRVEEAFPLRGSQGITRVTVTRTYELSENNELLICRTSRSTRTSGPGIVYQFKRAGTRRAFAVKLQDDWDLRGALDVQAFYISLQGAANVTAPRLYLLYPDNWPFTYVQSVFDFYKQKRHYTFTELRTPEEALKALRSEIKGYVVWDKNVRTSLIVAYTVAGLEQAVVVSEEMIPMVERAGLKKVEDLRGLFTGQTDAQIYTWAYKKYWDRCSREFIVWLGGEHGTVMKPAVADWGMHKKVFFNDLSSRPADTAEYALANKLLCEMKPMSMVMGWHSYAKDLERDHVKLTSKYGHRVEGLNTVPNVSFSAQIPPSPGYRLQEQPPRRSRQGLHSREEGLHLLHPDRRCLSEVEGNRRFRLLVSAPLNQRAWSVDEVEPLVSAPLNHHHRCLSEVEGSEVEGSEVEGSEVEGSEVEGSEVEGSEVEGSEVEGNATETPSNRLYAAF